MLELPTVLGEPKQRPVALHVVPDDILGGCGCFAPRFRCKSLDRKIPENRLELLS